MGFLREKGFSPVISATLILAVSTTLIVAAYLWAQGVISEFLNSVDEDLREEATRIQSEITILPPPTEVAASTSYVVVIDNSGRTTLHNVRAFYNGNQVRTVTTGAFIDTNGMYWNPPKLNSDFVCNCAAKTGISGGTADCSTEEIGDCNAGVVFNMPSHTIGMFLLKAPDANFSGDSIFVTADETSATYTFP
ncbi:MAG TPA: hypothetical protein VJA40_04050 [archaeon]|nr:hypothetical protein [archaeon]